MVSVIGGFQYSQPPASVFVWLSPACGVVSTFLFMSLRRLQGALKGFKGVRGLKGGLRGLRELQGMNSISCFCF